MNDTHFYAVIMAGGGGTRLWPLSRKETPKQMLKLTGGRSLFQMAVDRLEGVFPSENILVVTVAEQAAQLQMQCPQIPKENYLLEPMPRGTASVVGMAAVALKHVDPEATMAVLTADHFIDNVAQFQKLLMSAKAVAETGYLVTLGITPTYPATGYGYIHQGEVLGDYLDNTANQVIRFKEKPDGKLAEELVKRGDHVWNSGMFIWRVDVVWKELEKWMPQLTGILKDIAQKWGTEKRNEILEKLWPEIIPETIDYGIMERAEKVAVLPAADLGWNDVGSWDSLFDVLPLDKDGNILIEAQHIGVDTASSLICSSNPEKIVTTIGLENIVVIDTKDALLVCTREQAQKVKQIVDILKQTGQKQYL